MKTILVLFLSIAASLDAQWLQYATPPRGGTAYGYSSPGPLVASGNGQCTDGVYIRGESEHMHR
jgi:hypothetical protein